MQRHRFTSILPLLLTLLLGAACAPAVDPSPSARPATPTPTIGTSATPAPTISPVPSPSAGGAILDVVLTSGPHCPVETVPPDPNCAPRPVAGATVVVRDGAGREVGRGQSDATGHVRLTLPPGGYEIEALAFAGLMGTPERATATLADTGTTTVEMGYDTGIR